MKADNSEYHHNNWQIINHKRYKLTFLEAATIVNQLTDGKSTHAKLLADENKIPVSIECATGRAWIGLEFARDAVMYSLIWTKKGIQQKLIILLRVVTVGAEISNGFFDICPECVADVILQGAI